MSAPLTPREAEVAGLVVEGLKNREIAEKLSISKFTVEHHIQHILAKTGAADRFDVIRWLRRQAAIATAAREENSNAPH